MHPVSETVKIRTASRAKFLQGVSAGFRHAERRKPAAAGHVDIFDIVDESDAPDCCREFPPFAPFPPVVFLSHPKVRSRVHRIRLLIDGSGRTGYLSKSQGS